MSPSRQRHVIVAMPLDSSAQLVTSISKVEVTFALVKRMMRSKKYTEADKLAAAERIFGALDGLLHQ